IIACYIGKFMPWYYLFLIILLLFIFILPIGIVAANTNQTIPIYVLSEFVAGAIMHGNLIAAATFRTYSFNTLFQAVTFINYLKLSHYMKIPPRTIFIAQVVGTCVSAIVSYSITDHFLNTVHNMCTTNGDWTCVQTISFYNKSIWTIIGLNTMFGKTGIYRNILWCFLLGAVLPIPFWLLSKKYPYVKWLNYVHIPVMLSAVSQLPYIPPGNILSWVLVGFIFKVVIRKWWLDRYALLFSAAMDAGVGICIIFIYFILTNKNILFPKWWGLGGIYTDGCPLSHKNYYGYIPSS
ncbi:unnamed protein product, partial [Didymodactylos carnosus]